MKDKEEITIDGEIFVYDDFYDRLQHKDALNRLWSDIIDVIPSIRCSKCTGKSFEISYGNYECIANCPCGHSFTIYDG